MPLIYEAQGKTGRYIQSAPQFQADGVDGPMRLERRGELIAANLFNGMQEAGVEGSYFNMIASGTIDTGINTSVATGTTLATTQALAVIYNGEPAGGKDIILDYIKNYQITVDTATTFWNIVGKLDRGNRISSGGTVATIVNSNPNGANPTNIQANFGAVTATTETSEARVIHRNMLRSGVGVKGLETILRFGGQEVAASATVPATTAVQYNIMLPPVVIPPGWSYVLLEFATSRTATGTSEFYAGAIAR